MAATIAALDDAGLMHAVLIGHSAGAEVALGVSLREARRVLGLVLIAPVVGQGAPALARAIARLPGSARVGPAALRAASPLLGPALRRMWYDPSPVDASVVDGYRRPLLEPGVTEALWAMTKDDASRGTLAGRVSDVRQPALVLLGDADRWAKPVALPNCRVVRISKCGHLPHEEQPARTAAEIEAFLSTISS